MTITTDMLDALRQWAAAERDNDHAELANARLARDQAIEAAAKLAESVPGAVYVVVCQNDKPHPSLGVDKDGPIVHETYVREGTLPKQMQRAAVMERWGACRVARLVFEDEPGFAS